MYVGFLLREIHTSSYPASPSALPLSGAATVAIVATFGDFSANSGVIVGCYTSLLLAASCYFWRISGRELIIELLTRAGRGLYNADMTEGGTR